MPKAPNASGAFLGFDVGNYPGDALMQVWWDSSPYQFAGYYLQAPCHKNFTLWEGHRAALAAMGWSLLVIYVGQQRPTQPGCGQNILTAAQGKIDALDAANHAATEGFPAGAYIYLDIETGDPFAADLSAYLSGWVPEIVASGFGVGIYCSRNIATQVKADVVSLGAATPRFWIFGDGAGANQKFKRASSAPADSKVAFATAWQSLTHTQTWGGKNLAVDESVSLLSEP
jgi:hypothetical protein